MAKLSTKTALTTVASGDYMYIVDLSDLTDGADGTSKKITITNLMTKANVGLGNVDNTSDATKNSATATLTNKRITRRVTTEVSSATPTINTDNTDVHRITALAVNISSFTTNLSGTPNLWDVKIIEIIATATRTITWGASFSNGGIVDLPLTTVGTTPIKVLVQWNGATWTCIGLA